MQENWKVYKVEKAPRHCEERSDEAIHTVKNRLLRFARNDEENEETTLRGTPLPSLRGRMTKQSTLRTVIARSVATKQSTR